MKETGDKEPQPLRISLEDARRHYDDGAIVLDVIDTDSYDQYSNQIVGAVRIAPEDVPDE